MRNIFFIVFIFFTCTLSAQQWKTQYDSFLEKIQEQNYVSALAIGNALLPQMEKETGADTNYADVSYYMGYAHYAIGQYQDAVNYAEKERTIRIRWQGKNHMSYINATYLHSVYLCYVPDYASAIPLMQEVAEAANQWYGNAHPQSIHMWNQLANIYNLAGSHFKAEEIYTEMYNLAKKNYTVEDSIYRVVMNTVSTFYYTNGKFEKSEPFFIDALLQQEKVYGKKSVNYLASLYSTGEFYIYAGMFSKAENTWIEYEKIILETEGKKSPDYALALNNLAVAYEKQEKLKEAEKTYLKCLNLKAALYTKKSAQYAVTLSNLAVVYDKQGLLDKAEKTTEEALRLYETLYGTENNEYATALNNIGATYLSNGKYDKALKMMNQSLEIYKKIYGESSAGFITALDNLAGIYADMGNYTKSVELYLQVIALREKTQGNAHTELGSTYYNTANVYLKTGNTEAAAQLIERALSIQKKAVGEYHSAYATAFITRAMLNAQTGNYRKAEEDYNHCVILFDKVYGRLHPEYAALMNNMGLFYFDKGEYEKAEEMLETALKIQSDAYGSDHPGNISVMSNIGNLLVEQHSYQKAEDYLMRSLKLIEQKLGTAHPDYGTAMNNLATFYDKVGNYDKAQQYYELALEHRKKIYGNKHAEYATSLNNLGTLFLSRATNTDKPEEFKKFTRLAELHFKQALEVDSIIGGKNHPDRAGHLNNLGETYRLCNEFTQAEKAFLEAIAIQKNVHGENISTAYSYHNLSLLCSGKKDFVQAEHYALKAKALHDKTFGENSPTALRVISSLGTIYEMQNDYVNAEKCFSQCLSIQRSELEQNFLFMSEEEKGKYFNSISFYNDMFNAFAVKASAKNESLKGTIYNNELFNKGILLRSSSRLQQQVLNSSDTALISLYNRWLETKEKISVCYAQPVNERKDDLKVLEEKANTIEKDLTARSENLKRAIENKNTGWKEVKSKLKPGEAAIEFIHFLNHDAVVEDGYYAMILKSESEYPAMVRLFAAHELTAVIGTTSANNIDYIQKVYGKQKELNTNLYRLVWQPMEKELAGIKQIYYSPTGLLHKISFAALGDSLGNFIADKYELNAVNNTAVLVSRSEIKIEPAKTRMFVFGGVKYNTESTKTEVWKYLPGTQTEADKITAAVLKGGIKAASYTGNEATEQHLKEMSLNTSPDLLHIATHGFFYSDPDEVKQELAVSVSSVNFRGSSRGVKTFVENENPLMRSGIVLAGANDVWNDENNKKEDGVLTAYEVSLLNLENTKLAVLSACETGLGDIKGSEGVYGLQRAFRMAGVDMLVMSLWQVPDKETEEFMVDFYSALLKTKNIRTAFNQTQKMMREKYDPYFWGAFVLVE